MNYEESYKGLAKSKQDIKKERNKRIITISKKKKQRHKTAEAKQTRHVSIKNNKFINFSLIV